MRKYLLSTSALAGAALLSSAAVADVSISGTFEWDYAARDSNIAANDGSVMGQESDVDINFTNKTDSGLTITAGQHFDTNSAGQDDVFMSIAGGFGTIKLGKTDGANGTYESNAMGLVQEEEGGTLYSVAGSTTTATISTSTGGGGLNNNQVSYHIPAVGGLTAGISSGTGTIASDNEFTGFGMKYALEAGGANVTLGYSVKNVETSTAADTDTMSMGVTVAMDALSVSLTNGTKEGNDEDITTNAVGLSYNLGNGLVVAAGAVSSEDDLDAGEEYDLTSYEAAYTIASGLSAVLNVSEFDYENGTNPDASQVDINGTNTSLTIKASF
jgi:hypothetical protein